MSQRCIIAALLLLGAATRVDAQDPSPLPAIEISLSPSQQHWRAPLMEAAEQAAAIARDWLGPHPSGAIAVAEQPPLWQGAGAMVAEQRVAAAVIRSWWPDGIADQQARLLLDGFAAYLQGTAIEQLFDRRYLRRARRAESMPLFGGGVVWSFPSLRLSRFAGEPDRHAGVFTALERWLGEPVLQGGMAVVAQLPRNALTGTAIVNTLSAAAGQDVSWLLIAGSDPATAIDYAVTDLSSSPGTCAVPCIDTSVTVARLGEATLARDALALRVSFANGASAWAHWDGRDESRLFRFQGPAAATAAHLDPDRVIALDRNALNNAVVRPAPTNVPVRKWMARWLVWMQNAILTYGFFA
jgi:hypothetical protein